MEVNKILKMKCSESDKLRMLFSNRMDTMNVLEEGRGAVTVKVWDDLFRDLIAWKNDNATDAMRRLVKIVDSPYPGCGELQGQLCTVIAEWRESQSVEE